MDYNALNKPTCIVQPAKRQTSSNDSEQVREYDTLNNSTDELPVAVTNDTANGTYSLLQNGHRLSTEPKFCPVSESLSDGKYSRVTTDNETILRALRSREGLDASVDSDLQEGDKLETSAKIQQFVFSSEEEYAITEVKQPVSASPDQVPAGEVPQRNEVSSVSAGAYEEIEFNIQQPSRSIINKNSNLYAVPEKAKATGTGTTVPSMTEYSEARPDSIQSMEILSDCLVVAADIATCPKESEIQFDDAENPYSLPDESKLNKGQNGQLFLPPTNSEYSYANPDLKRPVLIAPDRLAMGKDQYALPVRRNKSTVEGKFTTTSPPPNSPKLYKMGEDRYAVLDKQSKKKPLSSGQRTSDATTPIVPDHIMVGNDQYAVLTKRSAADQGDTNTCDRGFDQQIDHYWAGEDQYAVSTKASSSLPYSKVAENSVDKSANHKESSDVHYADLDDFETKSTGSEDMVTRENVENTGTDAPD
jgi:hypothetical protein